MIFSPNALWRNGQWSCALFALFALGLTSCASSEAASKRNKTIGFDRSSGRPDWIDGHCDSNRFLCGMGSGGDQKSADLDARGELARIFESNIQTVGKSFESSAQKLSSKFKERWEETQNVSQFSMVSTDKVVPMSEIVDRYTDGQGHFWALALIDRNQARASLTDKITALDQEVAGDVDRAKNTSDNFGRFKSLRHAVGKLREREAINSDLRVIDRSGQGVPAPHSLGEVVDMLTSTSATLALGIVVVGPEHAKVEACLEEEMTKQGYTVKNLSTISGADDRNVVDVMLRGEVVAEKGEMIAGNQVANVSLTVRLLDGKRSNVVKSYSGQEKGSRGNFNASVATAAAKICRKKVGEIVRDIDSSFSKD